MQNETELETECGCSRARLQSETRQSAVAGGMTRAGAREGAKVGGMGVQTDDDTVMMMKGLQKNLRRVIIKITYDELRSKSSIHSILEAETAHHNTATNRL